MSGKKRKRLQIVVLIIAGAMAAGTTVYFVFVTGTSVPSSGQVSGVQTGQRLYSEQVDVNNRPETYLYFANLDNSFLSAEKRHIHRSDDPADFGKKIIHELIEGPRNKLARTLPEQTVLHAFYVSDTGIAYADFSPEIKDYHPGGSHSELLTIYSIVNSIVYNVPSIKAVKILINGNEATTLAGHIGLGAPIRANMVMVR